MYYGYERSYIDNEKVSFIFHRTIEDALIYIKIMKTIPLYITKEQMCVDK